MTGTSFDVTVVGGGIVGLLTAYRLSEAGARVCVLDAGQLARESSWAGGGIICPVAPWHYDPWVEHTVHRSRELLSGWLPHIESLSGIDCEYRVTGLLLSGNPAEHDFVAQAQDWMKCTQERWRVGTRGDFDDRLPEPHWPALLLPEVPQVRNPRLAQSTIGALRKKGVTLMPATPVTRIASTKAEQLKVYTRDGALHRSKQVVLACGAWTDAVLIGSGLPSLGIRPVRGQMLLFRLSPSLAPSHIINTGEGYLIPRADGHILAGSTVEEVGFDCSPRPDAYQRIKTTASRIWPGLANAPVIAHWWGFRPGLDQVRPVLGAMEGQLPGLFINAGHYRNGLGLAPACAEELAQAMGWG